jgi:predicted metal-dependent hydrolase
MVPMDFLVNIDVAANAFNTEVEVAAAIARRSPDHSLSRRDIEELISATSRAQGKIALTERLLHFAQIALHLKSDTDL